MFAWNHFLVRHATLSTADTYVIRGVSTEQKR
jgi:hypothetical protein